MILTPGQLTYKDPDAAIVYGFDWTAWLGSGAIASSTFTVTGPDAALTADHDGITTDALQTRVRLTAGTRGRTYTITNRIVTNETPPQTDDRSFRLQIVES